LYKIEWMLNIVCYFELLRKELFTTLALFNFDLGEIIFFTKTMNLVQNDFGSIHTLLWSALINHQTSITWNMCGLSSNSV
jgi:hypothetical protein